MRRSNKTNPAKEKELARRKYAERQIDKWWKWSYEMRGCIKYKELKAIQERYNIKVHG